MGGAWQSSTHELRAALSSTRGKRPSSSIVMTLFSGLGVSSDMAAPSRWPGCVWPPPVQPDSGPPALPNCAKHSVRHPPTWADSAVGDHDDRGDSTNHRKLAEHNLSLPLASYARRYTRRTCRQWPEISTDDNILHRNKVDNIPHRCRDYNILHRNRVDNIPHSNMDIHSTHAYRLDDRPAERADGRVHNSTVHNLVELVWSPSSHSTVLRSWMGTLSQRRQR